MLQLEFNKLGVITLKEVAEFQEKIFNKCRSDMATKGNDYSGNGEDTFANIRVASDLGLVSSPSNSAFVRALDKVMRIKNLTNPKVNQEVKDESLEDTLGDLINYFTYIILLDKERRYMSELSDGKNGEIPGLSSAMS